MVIPTRLTAQHHESFKLSPHRNQNKISQTWRNVHLCLSRGFSVCRYPTRRGSSQDRLLIKMNEREQMASSQLETAQWLERLENRRDMNFSLSLYIPVEPLEPKVWPRFMSLFLMMVSEADRSHVLNVSLLRLHRFIFSIKKYIQTNSKQYLMSFI